MPQVKRVEPRIAFFQGLLQQSKLQAREAAHQIQLMKIYRDDESRRTSNLEPFLNSRRLEPYAERFATDYTGPSHWQANSQQPRNVSNDASDRAMNNLRSQKAELEADLTYLESLPEDWDGEGAQRYTRDDIDGIKNWIAKFISDYEDFFGEPPAIPRAGQAESRSIDLIWSTRSFRLLANLPSNPDQVCTFHGFSTQKGDTELQGRSSPSDLSSSIKYFVRDFIQER